MARLTTDQDALVVRLVYDGPPLSGKTTSLRALAAGMACGVVSPGEEAGRTLYFDWLEYTGGSFDGLPIRCQILSVPGQRELSARRHALLAEADAIVFVTNSTPEHLPGAAAHLRGLREHLELLPSPRPGVVVQANHRDQAEAVPLPALEAGLALGGLPLVESVATESQGVREAFVLAVRLAVDRARELLKLGTLPAGEGETDGPEALLAWLESENPREPVREESTPTIRSEISRVPWLPDGDVSGGWVWPPVDGRVILRAAKVPRAAPQCGQDGSWRLAASVWRFHSAARHEFEHLADAQEALARWAQRTAPGFGRLSPSRCIALAETGWGTWRLWQVVRAEETWRRRLETALWDGSPGAADLLRTCAARLLEARAAFRLEPPLPCRLDVIGESQGRPAYVGLLPPPGWSPPADELAISSAALLQREVQPLVEAAAAGNLRGALEELLAKL